MLDKDVMVKLKVGDEVRFQPKWRKIVVDGTIIAYKDKGKKRVFRIEALYLGFWDDRMFLHTKWIPAKRILHVIRKNS